MSERPRGYEYKHLEIPQNSTLVDFVINEHAKFWWELTGTQTVVAKESHLERGEYNSDNLYSVTTTERFVAIDLRRPVDTPDLQKVKEVETRHFDICTQLTNLGSSPLSNYSDEPPSPSPFNPLIFLCGLLFYILPGVKYYKNCQKNAMKHEDDLRRWRELRSSREALLRQNTGLLNVAH